jgi:hypothetical protein
VVNPCRIQEAREIRGVLRRIHRDFHDPIGDELNGPFRIATRPSKRSPNRAPGPRKLVELDAFAL